MNMQEKLDQILGKEISQASNEEIYDALLTIVQEMASKKRAYGQQKEIILYFGRISYWKIIV